MTQPLTGTVTFLFTDIEGSTERWEHHPKAMAPALERHDSLVREIIEDHGGYIFKVVGDAFCAAFDTATAAVAAAVETQRAVTKEDWAAFGAGFPPLRIRMALHTGETQERGQDYFGAPVNRVARLESAANGGQVLMTHATERIVSERLPVEATIRDLGENRLKDLRYAEHIFQILAPAPASPRPRSSRASGPTTWSRMASWMTRSTRSSGACAARSSPNPAGRATW
jgi:class 3 adenylate cyclase